MIERLEDSDGLGAILPAMASSVLALRCLGYAEDHPLLREGLAALDGLLLRDEAGALRMQPCLSPVWDTVLAGHALAQAGLPADHPNLAAGGILAAGETDPTRPATGPRATRCRQAAGTSSAATSSTRTSTTPAWR